MIFFTTLRLCTAISVWRVAACVSTKMIILSIATEWLVQNYLNLETMLLRIDRLPFAPVAQYIVTRPRPLRESFGQR